MLEVFLTFLRIGSLGFGGPIALVALIEREVCHHKRWLSVTQFAEIFAVCKLLPGPMAVQVAMCCGYQRRGRWGGLLAGIGFLLPALIMIILLGTLYQHNLNTSSPRLTKVLHLMQDATLAIIGCTVWDLGKVYVKNKSSWVLVLLSLLLIYQHPASEPLVIVGCGIAGVCSYKCFQKELSHFPVLMLTTTKLTVGWLKSELLYVKLGQLLLICLKAGEFSFGTGLAIIPLLHADLVTLTHWLSDKQFLDGITLGQITPGPTTISIVFFGLIIAGGPGLIIALIGFYLPPLVNSLLIIPWLWRKLTSSPYLKVFTLWAFPAVIGGISSATLKLGVAAISGYFDGALILSAVVIIKYKLLPIWALIPLCGVIGLISPFFSL